MMTKPMTPWEMAKAVQLINAWPPPVPLSPQAAQKQLDNIKLIRDWWEFFDTEMQNHAVTCGRVIRGDDQHDAHFKRALEAERQKWDDIYNHRDPFSLEQEAFREEMELKRQQEAAEKMARRQGAVTDQRSWIQEKYLDPLKHLPGKELTSSDVTR